jgi:hypothetical protein
MFFQFLSQPKVLFSDESLSSFLRGIGALQLILKGKKYQLIYNKRKIGFMKKVMMRLKQFTLINLRSSKRYRWNFCCFFVCMHGPLYISLGICLLRPYLKLQ